MKDSILQCVTTYHYQIISLLLFFCGLCGVIISRNFLKILISLEFIINAINLLFISFASYKSDMSYIGYSIVLFTTGISAIIMAIGLYMSYLIYKHFGTVEVLKVYDKYKDIKEC